MNFDESFFEEEANDDMTKKKGHGKPSVALSHPYAAKTCNPEWFNKDDVSCEEEDHVILKYRADLCYYRRQFVEAIQLYQTASEALPPTNITVHREVIDSLTRCYLKTRQPTKALHYATQLVAPPHHNDASSWQLLAQCHNHLGQTEDFVEALQKSCLLQRYDTSNWLLLSEAYTTFITALSKKYSARADICSSDCAKISNTDDDSLKAILSNTVTLFRPYFKWTCDSGGGDKSSCGNFETKTVWELLARHVSVETFLKNINQLPWEHHYQLLVLFFQVSSICCLIWAKQLQMYSARHSSSFARPVQSHRLRHIEYLIGCCRDDLTYRLKKCFNNLPVIS